MSTNDDAKKLNHLKACEEHEAIFAKKGFRNVKWTSDRCNTCRELVKQQLEEQNNKQDNSKTIQTLINQASNIISNRSNLEEWIERQRKVTEVILKQLSDGFSDGRMVSKANYVFYEELTVKIIFFDKVKNGLQRIQSIIDELEKKFDEKKDNGEDALNYNEKLELQARINAILIKVMKSDSDLFDFVTINQDTSATKINNIINEPLIARNNGGLNLMQEAFNEIYDNDEINNSEVNNNVE